MLSNNSKFLTFIAINTVHMKEKIKKLLHLIAMCVALAAVVFFAIFHAMTALDTQYGTLLMIGYGLMFIWATCRVVVLFKDYKSED